MKRFLLAVAVLALVGMTSTAFAQRERGRGFGGFGPSALLSIEEVQKELNLTDEQKQKLEALRSDRGSLRDLSREERRQKLQELAKKADETIKTTLDDKQKARLEELRLQVEGPNALTRPEVAEKLGLEQAQKDKIAKIREAGESTGRFDFQNATQEERQKYFAEARERREKANAELLAVLTPAQKEAFEKMKGAEFKFPERRRNRNRDNQ